MGKLYYWIGLVVIALSACTPPNPPASFTLEPVSQTIEVEAGSQTSLWVALKRAGGFSDTVRMRLDDLPDGIGQSWSRDTKNGDCSLALLLDSEVTPGEYTIKLVGETETAGASISQVRAMATSQTNLTLKVTSPLAKPSVSLVVNPSILALKRGARGTVSISIVRNNGFTGSFSLKLKGTNNPIDSVVASINDGVNTASHTFITTATQTPGSQFFEFKAEQFANGVTTVLASVPMRVDVLEELAPPGVELTFSPLSIGVRRVGQNAGANVFMGLIRTNFNDEVEFRFKDPSNELNSSFFNKDGFTPAFLVGAKTNARLGLHNVTLEVVKKSTGEVMAFRKDLEVNVLPTSGEADFFVNGTQQVNLPSGFEASKGLIVQTDKKFIVGGTLNGSFKLLRFNPDGSPDTGFGSGGIATATFGTATVKLVKIIRNPVTNGILAVGNFIQATGGAAIASFTSSGNPDSNFDGDGFKSSVVVPDVGDAVVIRGNNFAIVGSTLGTNTECRILALTQSGSPDNSFSGDGQQSLDPSLSVDVCTSAVAAGTGLAVAGSSNKGLGDKTKFLLARFADNGSLDESFGDKGTTITDVDTQVNLIRAMVRQSNGKFLGAGRGLNPTLVRYQSSGLIDTTFGPGGKGFVSLSAPVIGNEATALVIDSSNRVVVGTTDQVLRLNSSGGLDTSFATGGVKNVDKPVRAIALDSEGRILVVIDSKIQRLFP